MFKSIENFRSSNESESFYIGSLASLMAYFIFEDTYYVFQDGLFQ